MAAPDVAAQILVPGGRPMAVDVVGFRSVPHQFTVVVRIARCATRLTVYLQDDHAQSVAT